MITARLASDAMILGATALTKADTSSAGKIRKKVTCSTMASWAHPGNWICGRAGTGPSIDRSRPHHTDAAARPPAARGRGARGLRRGGAVTVASFFGMQEGSERLHDRADLQERVAE